MVSTTWAPTPANGHPSSATTQRWVRTTERRGQLSRCRRTPIEVDGRISGHRGDPTAERPRITQRAQALDGIEEDLLREILGVLERHARQQEAMHDRREAFEQPAKGRAVPRAGAVDERRHDGSVIHLTLGQRHLRWDTPVEHAQ